MNEDKTAEIFKFVVVFIIIAWLLARCASLPSNEPKDFKDMSKKEQNQFLDWRDKEQQKRINNE